jgi:hypothetical protein
MSGFDGIYTLNCGYVIGPNGRPVSVEQLRAEAEQRMPDYLRISARNSGQIMAPAAKAKRDAEKAEQRRLDQAIIDKLNAGGLDLRGGRQMYFVHLCSGEVEVIPATPSCNFLPSAAARKRNPLLRHVGYFMGHFYRPDEAYIASKGRRGRAPARVCGPELRMWVVDNGVDVTVEKVRAACQDLSRQISNLNAEEWFKALGLEIVWRSTELGSMTSTAKPRKKDGQWGVESVHDGRVQWFPCEDEGTAKEYARTLLATLAKLEGFEKRNKDGKWLYHPHAHLIVKMHRKLTPDEWTTMLRRVQAFFPGRFQESGAIRKQREVCKYFAKHTDLERHSPAELVALYHAMHRLHLAQPMGELKREIRMFKDHKKRLAAVSGEDGGAAQLQIVNNWNAHADGEKDEDVEKMEEAAKLDSDGTPCNVLVARLSPMPDSQGVYEPVALVAGLTVPVRDFIESKPCLEAARGAAWDAWQAGRALAAVSLDTTTVTAPGAGPRKSAERVRTGPSLLGVDPKGPRRSHESHAIHL